MGSLTNCDNQRIAVSAIILVDTNSDMGKVHLHPAMVKNNSISHQSSRDLLRHGWVHLHPAIVKNNSISHQSSRDLLRHGWVHLHPAIGKNNSISHQSSRDPLTYALQ
jgi:hypothetical protein